MDLVCGQILAENEALGPVLHEGDQYYFCSSRCQSHFLRRATPARKKVKAVILPFPIAQVDPHDPALEAQA
jgi:YHS domain-containing protein